MPNTIEKAASEGAGVAKAVGARVKGLYGVFTTLAKQHGEASVLLKRAESTEDPVKQQDIWRKLRAELLSHEQSESSEVYTVLGKHEVMQHAVLVHESEAVQLEAAVENVDAAAFGTDAWTNAVKALHELVKQHIAEEEKEFFPLATDVVDKQTAEDLDQRFKATKKSLMVGFGVE